VSKKVTEINFDGLVGPSHNYSGLSFGNVASEKNRAQPSNPRKAALEGLSKMKKLSDLGVKQAVLLPHERPYLPALRDLGFQGSDENVIRKAAKEAKTIFTACCSASAMWTANAGTTTPSQDSADGKVHFTPANLSEKFHRTLEADFTASILRKIFPDPKYFTHHLPLPRGNHFADEGAANHTRFAVSHADPGLHLFVFGRSGLSASRFPQTTKYPARQTVEASEAIARRHGLTSANAVFALQSPESIDAGVFHNDVISVGNERLFLCHESAFADFAKNIIELQDKFQKLSERELRIEKIKTSEVSVEAAVKSYLFNSQLVTLPDGKIFLAAPEEAQEDPSVRRCLERLQSEKIIDLVEFFDLRQSMSNGGGPACLRFRVVLNESEEKATHPGVFLNDALYVRLTDWVNKNYRDQLELEDLHDPAWLNETHRTLDELTQILGLGAVYSFQK